MVDVNFTQKPLNMNLKSQNDKNIQVLNT